MADGKVASDKVFRIKVFQVLQELLEEETGVVKVLNQILK
jgi:hypothetical protein